jgi:hypothetical protein
MMQAMELEPEEAVFKTADLSVRAMYQWGGWTHSASIRATLLFTATNFKRNWDAEAQSLGILALDTMSSRRTMALRLT